MATANPKTAIMDNADSIWMIVLDCIPFIGTGKNAVEAILALKEGDYATAGQKTVMTILGGAADVFTAGSNRALLTGGKMAAEGATRVALEIGTEQAVKAATRVGQVTLARAGASVITSVISKVGQNNTTSIEKRIKEISKEILKIKDPEPRTPPARGDHVINNGVLSVYRNIISQYLNEKHLNAISITGVLGPEAATTTAYNSSMRAAYLDRRGEVYHHRIERKYITYVTQNYGNANEHIFGTALRLITNYGSMKLRYRTERIRQTREYDQNERLLRTAVDNMVQLLHFVDHVAEMQYFTQHADQIPEYAETLQAVRVMFYNLVDGDIIGKWAAELHMFMNRY